MRIPLIKGIIRRRILLNFRIAPETAAAILPPNFRPKLVAGHAIAGICLIRLEKIRPQGLPGFVRIASGNSAHRIAVEWEDQSGATREGVFVPRRDTRLWLNSLAGGRVFPGVHHHSAFEVADRDGQITITVRARGQVPPLVDLRVAESDEIAAGSVFETLEKSSAYFESG